MSTDIATLGIKVDSTQVNQAGKDLDNLTDKGKKAEGSAKSVTSAFNDLKGALAALGLAAVAKELGQMADTYKNIQGRLSLVTKGTAELAYTTEKLFAISQRARVGFEATADLYTSLARSTKSLGTSQTDLLGVTETISKALIVSGANAQTAEGSLRQLGQAFASGALRGDELNSIMEGTPRIAQAIADGMGITIGQLRKLGAEGKLTGEAVFNALKNQKDAVEQEFAKMPVTIAQSFQLLQNEVLKFVGEADAANGASAAFAGGIQTLAKNLDTVVTAVEVLAVAFGIKLVAGFVASTAAALTEQAALLGLTSAAEVAGFAVGTLIARLAALSVLGGIALLIVAFVNDTMKATQAVDEANRSFAEMKKQAEAAGGGATTAAGHVTGLGKDALGSIPKIDAFGGRVGAAAQELYNMARAAKVARLEMLETQLAKSQQNEITLGNATPGGRSMVAANNRAALMRGDILGIDTSVATNRLRSFFSAGRTDRENGDAYAKQVQVSLDLMRRIREERDKPITPQDAPTPVAAAATGGGKKSGGKSAAETEYERAVKASKDYVDQMNIETSEMGKSEIEIHRMAAAREAAKAPTEELRMSILKAADAWEVAKIKEEAETKAAEEAKRVKEEQTRANAQQLKDGAAMIAQIEYEARTRGMNAKELEVEQAKREMAQRGIVEGTEAYKLYAAAILAAAEARGQLYLDADQAHDFADAMRDVASSIKEASDGFGEYFGRGVEGFANLMEVVSDYGAKRAEVEADIADAKARGKYTDEEAAKYNRQLANLEISNYGNMLGAAKTFFNEKSKGYKILQAAEMAFRMFQFAMSVKAMLFDSAETASSVAKSGIRTAAHAVEAVVKAIASLPFPFNLVAGAATAAAIAALGVTIFGGGGSKASASTGNMGGDGSTDTATSSAGFNRMANNYNVTNGSGSTGSNDNMPTRVAANDSGAMTGAGGMTMKLTVNQNAPGVVVESEQVGRDEIRLMIKQGVREDAPKAVAGDMANSNSPTSKALKANYQVAPRR